jgi:predicted amidohydrolase
MSSLTIATFQGRAIYEDIQQSLATVKKKLDWAEAEKIDILCFPECYLQGYLLDETTAQKMSIDLNSSEFQAILKTLQSETTIILGLIERESKLIYNTAVVIEKGKVKGKYRKHNLLKKENHFTPGTQSPIFEKNGVKYGINICSDTRLSTSILEMTNKGARLLFFLINNSLPHDVALKWKNEHVKCWVERAKESRCWICAADVIEESETNTGFGFTTIIDPNGKVVKSAEYLNEGILKQVIGF